MVFHFTKDHEGVAIDATCRLMAQAKDEVDGIFEDGYATEHPELVAAFTTAAAVCLVAAVVRDVAEELQECREVIEIIGRDQSEALKKHTEKLVEAVGCIEYPLERAVDKLSHAIVDIAEQNGCKSV